VSFPDSLFENFAPPFPEKMVRDGPVSQRKFLLCNRKNGRPETYQPKEIKMNDRKTITFARGAIIAALAMASLLTGGVLNADPLPGAIFTTDSICSGVDLNIYGSKDEVYIDGGPAHPGAASLPDGSYYVQVTNPDGSLVLGSSGNETPFVVLGGEPQGCYQLSAILNSASSGFTTPGYDDTDNPGGEYKVWVSKDSTFVNDSTKTDNFKVREGASEIADLCVRKFYDANVNGIWNDTEVEITGWQFTIFGTDNWSTMQIPHTTTPWCAEVDPDTFTVMEADPLALPAWLHTTPTTVVITLGVGQHGDVIFGNVCLGAGGGLTLGFWSNKNGQKLENAADFTALTALNLRTATGANQDFTSPTLKTNQTNLNTFLLGATATNMANMLSAQLAAMTLNVRHAFVNGAAIVSAPGCGNTGLNNQFITINDLMAAADAALLADGNTPAGDPNRVTQECLKNALDDANNNKNFVQGLPCTFSFGN
jgi:hypothetical protein